MNYDEKKENKKNKDVELFFSLIRSHFDFDNN